MWGEWAAVGGEWMHECADSFKEKHTVSCKLPTEADRRLYLSG